MDVDGMESDVKITDVNGQDVGNRDPWKYKTVSRWKYKKVEK